MGSVRVPLLLKVLELSISLFSFCFEHIHTTLVLSKYMYLGCSATVRAAFAIPLKVLGVT